MPYATIADLTARLGEARMVQLTDLASPPLGLPDDAVAQRALDDAEAEIDGYLQGRYALPLSPVPGVLRVHACTIAHYRLLGSAAGEVERADYASAIKYLQGVAQGLVLLLPPSEAPQPVGAGSVVFSAGSKVMGREAAEG